MKGKINPFSLQDSRLHFHLNFVPEWTVRRGEMMIPPAQEPLVLARDHQMMITMVTVGAMGALEVILPARGNLVRVPDRQTILAKVTTASVVEALEKLRKTLLDQIQKAVPRRPLMEVPSRMTAYRLKAFQIVQTVCVTSFLT
jgi:hypothetical protein